MSATLFKIVEHKVPTQHIREYPRATLHEQEDVLHLAVKQYIPLDNPTPQPGDITIIGAHACGFPKELYEPLWEDLLSRLARRKLRIRSIWIADVAQQGQSGILNEGFLGNDPSWIDHARDLLHMINLKRDQMPRPLVGIGHSMGGNHLYIIPFLLFRSCHSLLTTIQSQCCLYPSSPLHYTHPHRPGDPYHVLHTTRARTQSCPAVDVAERYLAFKRFRDREL